MNHHTPPSGYFQAAARGAVVGIVGLMLFSIGSGGLGMLMAGSGCFVVPFLVLIGGGLGSLGGVVYHWYQTLQR